MCRSFLSYKLSVAVFFKFQIVSLQRNHKSNLYKDHSNKINVLPQLAAPSILFKYFETKAGLKI